MKKILAGIAFMGAAAFMSAQTITFDKTEWDYGTVKPNSDGHRVFTVKNTGDKPLILSKVQASCGCTTPVWSQDPIMPGKTSQIKVGYNTAINGNFVKQIEVYSNDPVNSRTVLHIKGNVDANAPEPKPLTAAEQKKLDAENKAVNQQKKKEEIARLQQDIKNIKQKIKEIKSTM